MAEYGVLVVSNLALLGASAALADVTASYEEVRDALAQSGTTLGPMKVVRSGCCYRCASLGWSAKSRE